ncbi:MAG: hypothetical protein H7174_02520 [Flavobacterium sp.]|nr:hypothetical protein [Flavobacterium sp.]
MSRDILYWSTIGTSRLYSISLGLIEVFTAFLLLINRTRTLGLLFAIGVFTNVVLVNFGFDISVKTFSVLLLMMSIYGVLPHLTAILRFFIGNKMVHLSQNNFQFSKNISFNFSLKFFVVCSMIGIIFLPFAENGNFNDDDFSRPYLHGAYKVVENNQKESAFKIVQFYIHRKNYLILEFKNGQTIDYFCEINKLKKQIKITNYQSKIQFLDYKYFIKDSVLELDFRNIKLKGKAQNWRKMSVMKNDFHFVINQIR